MKRSVLIAGVLIAGLVAVGCGGSPPTAPAGVATPASGDTAIFSASGVEKIPIVGSFDYAGEDPPGRLLINPNDNFHFWDYPVYTIFDGDVAGPVTFHEKGMIRPDGSGVFSGPFEGEVVWNERSGMISGQFTTNCKLDPSVLPFGISCDGVLNARGSGGLEGVRFKFVWGPGFYPFPYTGTAYVK